MLLPDRCDVAVVRDVPGGFSLYIRECHSPRQYPGEQSRGRRPTGIAQLRSLQLNRTCIPDRIAAGDTTDYGHHELPGDKGSNMREIGAIAAYLISWLFCELVIGIQSGLITLIISLLFAFGIYVLIAVAEHEEGDKNA